MCNVPNKSLEFVFRLQLHTRMWSIGELENLTKFLRVTTAGHTCSYWLSNFEVDAYSQNQQEYRSWE